MITVKWKGTDWQDQFTEPYVRTYTMTKGGMLEAARMIHTIELTVNIELVSIGFASVKDLHTFADYRQKLRN